MGGTHSSNPYEDITPTVPYDQGHADEKQPPKPVVMSPKFVPPPDTQNPFDTASQQAERYANAPQPL